MGVLCPTTSDWLTRNGTFINPAADWTRFGWFRIQANPAASSYTLSQISTDLIGPPYIWLAVDGTVQVVADPGSGGVSVDGVLLPTALTWFHAAIRYKASTTTLSILVNGVQINAGVVDLSALPGLVIDHLGNDESALAGVAIAYLFDYQAWLTDAEIAAQMRWNVVRRSLGLLAYTPLTSITDLADASGNGHDWTAVGSLSTVASPGLTSSGASPYAPIKAPVVNPETGRITKEWQAYFTSQKTPLGGMQSLSGDGTATGPGAVPFTLAMTGVTPGVYGDSTHVPRVTVDAKGRALAASSVAIAATGDVVGPASAVDGHLAVYNGVTGKLIKDGGAAPTGTNTGDVTLAGTPAYLTIAGQIITRLLINLASHVTGTLPIANGGIGAITFKAAGLAAAANIKSAIIAGGVAGNLTVTGVAVGDQLVFVTRFVGAGVAVTDVTDLTAEFTISGANTINNTGGTNTTGDKLQVFWVDLT